MLDGFVCLFENSLVQLVHPFDLALIGQYAHQRNFLFQLFSLSIFCLCKSVYKK